MNRILLAAAVLAAFTAAVHTVVGTSEIAGPLFQATLAPETALLLYGCWHFVSVFLALSAVALFLARRRLIATRAPQWSGSFRGFGFSLDFLSWRWALAATAVDPSPRYPSGCC